MEKMNIGNNFACMQNLNGLHLANFAFKSKRNDKPSTLQNNVDNNTLNNSIFGQKTQQDASLNNGKKYKPYMSSNFAIFISKCINSLSNGASRLTRKIESLENNILNGSRFLIKRQAIEMAQQSKSKSVTYFETDNVGMPEKIEFDDGTIWEMTNIIAKTNEKQNNNKAIDGENLPDNYDSKTIEDDFELDNVKYKIMKLNGKLSNFSYKLENKTNSVILKENSITLNGITYRNENGRYVFGTRVLDLKRINNLIG